MLKTIARKLSFIFLLVFLVAMPFSHAIASDLLTNISKANENISSSSIDFSQETSTLFFKTPIRSEGHLSLVRPQKLRWEYITPNRSGFILNGAGSLQWNEQLKTNKIESTKLSPVLKVIASQMLLWLNLDQESLAKDFKIRQIDELSLELTPIATGMKDYISTINLTFSPDNFIVEKISITEATGGITVITMSNIQTNIPFPASTFSKP